MLSVMPLRDESMYEPLSQWPAERPDLQKDNDSEWNDILADPTYVYCADETKEAVKRFIESDIPAPDALGYELLDENEGNHCAVRARMGGWEDRVFPVLRLESDRENANEFVKRGWTIITENNDDLDKVFASLTERHGTLMADIRTMNKPVVALGSDLMRSLLELP